MIPIFPIASSEDVKFGPDNFAEVTRQTYQLSGSERSQFLLYDNAGQGSEMLKTRPELITMISGWYAEKVGQ